MTPIDETYKTQRTEWAQQHTMRLTALFDLPVFKEVPQRIWRTAYVDYDGDYISVTLCQNLNVPAASPNQQVPKIQTYISRPYWRAANGSSGVQQHLLGQYSPREIVAFLGLDRVDPDSVVWTDETHYSDILRVGGVLSPMRQD